MRAEDVETLRLEADSEASGGRAWLRVLLDAIRGRTGDPTSGPLGRAIVLLAVPMVLEMAMESIFAVVDIFFVSRLGAEAMAAVGLTEALMAIVYTVAIGLSIGATAVVARRMGERNRDAAAEATVQVAILGLVVAAFLGVFGGLYAPDLLRLMGADAVVVGVGTGYARVMLGGNGVILLLFLLNAAFRGAGDPAIAMRVLWVANGLNIVLDPLLIYGVGPFPELGVTGAAAATTIGRGTGVLLQLVILFRLSERLRVRAGHLRLLPAVMGRVLRLSGTGMLQVFIGTASWMVIMRILSDFGPEALAGYTITIRIVLFALLPAWGLANAAATMVGQGLGAGDPERAERSVWLAARMNLYFLGCVAVLFVLAAPEIVSIFGGGEATAGYAIHGLRVVSLGFVFYAYGMVIAQSFNGAGDAWTPTLLNVLCFWLGELPLAWFLAHAAGLGPSGVFIAITVAFSVLAVVSTLVFRRGRWKLKVV